MRKKTKRVMAVVMTVLMLITLVPTWLFSGVFSSVVKAEEKTYVLDVSKDLSNGDITADTTKCGTDDYFTILASSAAKVSVDDNGKKNEDGSVNFTKRIKFNGGSSDSARRIRFTTGGEATITVYMISGSSKDATRTMSIQDSNGKEVGNKATAAATVTDDKITPATFTVPEAGTYDITVSAAINVYSIKVVEKVEDKKVSIEEETKILDVSTDLSNGDITADTTKCGTDDYFTILASSAAKVSVDDNGKKNEDGSVNFTKRIKFNGGSSDSARRIRFTTGGEATITVYMISGSSKDATRTMSIQDSNGKEVGNKATAVATVTDDKITPATFTVPEAGTYDITVSAAINVYYIKVVQKIVTGGATGTQPEVSAINAKYNEETGKIDVEWTASTEAEGDGKYAVLVNGESKATVKAGADKKVSVDADKSGTYSISVIGVLGDKKNDGVSTEVTVVKALDKAKLDTTLGTSGTIKVSWSKVNEADSYVVNVYDSSDKLVADKSQTVTEVNKDSNKYEAVITGLKDGYKYSVEVIAKRNNPAAEKTSDKVTVRPYASVDTKDAIKGAAIVDQDDEAKLIVVREGGNITVSQPSTSGGLSSSGITKTSFIALNEGKGITGDFTLTADVNVASVSGSTAGVFVGAFEKLEEKGQMATTAIRGGLDATPYVEKSAKKFSPAVTYSKNKTYTLVLERSGNSFKSTIKDGDNILGTKTVDVKEDALKTGKELIPAIALCNVSATFSNVVLQQADKVLFDSSKLEGSFNPYCNNWDVADVPELSESSNADGKIVVNVTGEIGVTGASKISVDMKNAAGQVVETESTTAMGQERTLTFTPDASGDYTFVATASRTGVDSVKTSKEITVKGFILPIAAPVLNTRTADASKIEVSWDAVPEATSYKVEYKKVDAAEYTFLTETSALSATTPSLTVGDVYVFRVTAVRSSDGQSKTSNETQQKVADHEQFTWKFSAFGQGVSVADNLSDKAKSPDGYSGGVNTDEGTVNVWSLNSKGKLVPASTDGLSFYYATIPSNKNFTLTATAKVNAWTYTNGQEGFGLMAADAVGTNGDASVFWNNSYMASATKVEYYSYIDPETGDVSIKNAGDKISMKLGIGSQEKIGVTKANIGKLQDNDSDTVNNEFKTTMSTLETSKLGKEPGTYNLFGNYTNTDSTFVGTTVENPITEIKLTIQKNNTGYFVSYTDANGNTTTKKYYETDALSQIDSDNVYVGMFASRTCDVTYSDISLTTIDPADDAPAEERPVEYTDILFNVTSASTASSEDYTFKGMSTADGHVVLTKGNDVIGETDVTANESFAIDTQLVAGDNKFVATFTPDSDFRFGDYELPTSYDPIEVSKNVTYAYFTGDLIYVSADATKEVDEAKANETYSAKAQINAGKGTRENPIDIYNAVAYARAGQKILLMDGDYKVANNVLIPFGIDGTEEKPIYLMPESTDSRVVLDFAGTTGEGVTLCGNYWYIQNIDVTNSANGKDGMHVCGSHNIVESVNTYKNGNTGIQISRFSSAQDKDDWPAYNTIRNCTSHNNADAGYEDADGFAAKLTIGKGNVFVGCIAHHNADDGWDFFAKVETGNIPSVVIMNCVAYGNGYIESEGGLIDAGNGNGFKMGGSSLPGSHVIVNSVAFNNKSKGIDSNSCPDNVVVGCTSFNNEANNVALYTNDAKNTNFRTNGVISFRNDSVKTGVKVADNFKSKGTQDAAKLFNASDYYWMSAAGTANDASVVFSGNEFVTLNTNDVKVTRNADGTINMNGLGMLTADARKLLGTGIGADSLDKAPQLTAEGYALIAEALGVDEANRILSTSLASSFIPRNGSSGALTGDSNHIMILMMLLMASIAVAAGVVVYEKKRKVMAK